jgi:hypothetical protein
MGHVQTARFKQTSGCGALVNGCLCSIDSFLNEVSAYFNFVCVDAKIASSIFLILNVEKG